MKMRGNNKHNFKSKYGPVMGRIKARQNWARVIAKVMKRNRIQKKRAIAKRKQGWRSWARRTNRIGPPKSNWSTWARNKRYESRRYTTKYGRGGYMEPYRYSQVNRPYRWRD